MLSPVQRPTASVTCNVTAFSAAMATTYFTLVFLRCFNLETMTYTAMEVIYTIDSNVKAVGVAESKK